jgi:hypothetical protein
MPARRFAASLILVSFATYGQAQLDDATILKLVKAGIGEEPIVAMVNGQPGRYALSSDDVIALKKAGVSDKILAAMIARSGAADSSAPVPLALRDGTPIRLSLARDLTFTNIKPGEMADFEILDDLRIGGLLVMTHGVRATATIVQAEPKTRAVRGGKLGVSLAALPLLNGDKVAIRAAQVVPGAAHVDATGGAADLPSRNSGGTGANIVRPATPSWLFEYGNGEAFPEGTGITVYIDGDIQLDPARFLVDLSFTSNPPGALVAMYGAPIGRTPFTTRLAPGTYKAVFSADGYRDLRETVSVGPGYSNTVHVAFQAKP